MKGTKRCGYIGLLLMATTASATSQAATVGEADLPETIQTCISSSTCWVGTNSLFDSGRTAVFDLWSTADAFPSFNYLVRYSLADLSTQYQFGSSPSGVATEQTDHFGGYLWLSAQQSYDLAESDHAFTLYLDKASPEFIYSGQSGDLELTLNTEDVLAGSGYSTATFYDSIENSGSLGGEIPLMCVASGCGIAAQLNLVNLFYQIAGDQLVSNISTADTRTLVYAQRNYYLPTSIFSYSNDVRQSLYVAAPVPIPAGVWLLGSGLLGLIGAIRRKSSVG